ncbi:MAG: glycosyltransferase family 2 protein, partial [Candidatus Methanospirareceae archaeon]
MPDVSVVMPSLDEEGTIGACIEKVLRVFAEQTLDGEIIVADNSSDKTPEIARSLGAIVITPEQRGYGNAYRAGLAHATGKYIVIGDADGTYNFSEIQKFLQPLMNGDADLVMGNRFGGTIYKGAMP